MNGPHAGMSLGEDVGLDAGVEQGDADAASVGARIPQQSLGRQELGELVEHVHGQPVMPLSNSRRSSTSRWQ